MSASVKITGLGNVKKSVTEMFNKTRKDPALLLEIGEALQKDVVANARTGQGPDKTSFKTLEISWLVKRDYLKRFNKTSEFFIDSLKSNLTFTGEFLKSIKYSINPSEGLAVVEPTGTHPGYKMANKTTKPVDNKIIAKGLEDLGFKFLFVSKAFRKRTTVIVRRFLRRKILNNK